MRLQHLLATCLAAACVAPGYAAADSCRVPWDSMFEPVPGAVDLPTTTLVWIGTRYLYESSSRCGCEQDRSSSILREPVLSSVDGSPVPGRLHHLRNRGWSFEDLFVFIPDQQLQPNTTYRVRRADAEWIFRTGPGAGPPAPPPPEVGSKSGSDTSVDFFVTSPGCTVVVAEQSASARPIHSIAELDEVADVACGGLCEAGSRGMLSIGQQPCGANVDGVAPGASADVAFGCFDIAGNFSGWSAPARAQFVPDRWGGESGSGCSCVAGGTAVPSPALVPVLAILIGLRRRAPHRIRGGR